MIDLEVIDDAAIATVALDSVRSSMLALLAEPGSATTLAAALDLPRQQVNYHLRVLETKGLVRLVEERPRRGLTERVMQATASAYVVSTPIGALQPEVACSDQLSARYLIALAARLVREVSGLVRRADAANQRLATLSIDADVRLGSAADRAAFTAELSDAVRAVVARYHDESAPTGRWHRLVVASHPRPAPNKEHAHE